MWTDAELEVGGITLRSSTRNAAAMQLGDLHRQITRANERINRFESKMMNRMMSPEKLHGEYFESNEKILSRQANALTGVSEKLFSATERIQSLIEERAEDRRVNRELSERLTALEQRFDKDFHDEGITKGQSEGLSSVLDYVSVAGEGTGASGPVGSVEGTFGNLQAPKRTRSATQTGARGCP